MRTGTRTRIQPRMRHGVRQRWMPRRTATPRPTTRRWRRRGPTGSCGCPARHPAATPPAVTGDEVVDGEEDRQLEREGEGEEQQVAATVGAGRARGRRRPCRPRSAWCSPPTSRRRCSRTGPGCVRMRSARSRRCPSPGSGPRAACGRGASPPRPGRWRGSRTTRARRRAATATGPSPRVDALGGRLEGGRDGRGEPVAVLRRGGRRGLRRRRGSPLVGPGRWSRAALTRFMDRCEPGKEPTTAPADPMTR